MTKLATVAAAPGFLVTIPQGAPTTLPSATPRGQQLHTRLQGLQHTLLPPKSEYSWSNYAINTGVVAGLASFMGVYFAPMALMRGDTEGYYVAGGALLVGATSAVLHLVGKVAHAKRLGSKGDAHAAQVEDLASSFAKLSDLEHDLVAYRAQRLMHDLHGAHASSPKLGEKLAPMVEAYEALSPARTKMMSDVAALVDAIVLPTGEIAPSARGDTEILIRGIESLSPETRAVVANLVRGAVQIAIDTNDGHRWRLRRLLEALDGARVPYAHDEAPEPASPPSSLPHQEVTLDRCVTLLKGGLAVERAAEDPMRASTKIIPSTHPALAEQSAAYFERAGYRAAIFDDGKRLVVSVFTPGHPPTGAFVQGTRTS